MSKPLLDPDFLRMISGFGRRITTLERQSDPPYRILDLGNVSGTIPIQLLHTDQDVLVVATLVAATVFQFTNPIPGVSVGFLLTQDSVGGRSASFLPDPITPGGEGLTIGGDPDGVSYVLARIITDTLIYAYIAGSFTPAPPPPPPPAPVLPSGYASLSQSWQTMSNAHFVYSSWFIDEAKGTKIVTRVVDLLLPRAAAGTIDIWQAELQISTFITSSFPPANVFRADTGLAEVYHYGPGSSQARQVSIHLSWQAKSMPVGVAGQQDPYLKMSGYDLSTAASQPSIGSARLQLSYLQTVPIS